MRTSFRRGCRTLAVAGAGALALLAGSCGGDRYTAGLVIKQDRNPFFRQIRETAERMAERDGLHLEVLVGRSDVDSFSQVIAMGSLVREGAKAILITPASSRGVVPGVRDARRKGVPVIALDTPTAPVSAANAVFATDNREAGKLIGRYAKAKAAELGLVPKIAMLDDAHGVASSDERHAGFLEGFGIAEGDPGIVASVRTNGDEAMARRGMARLLRRAPGVNVVYTINEPAAFGAAAALRAAGKLPAGVVLVSVDGGCRAIRRSVASGAIDATAQQYPERMAREGIAAVSALAHGRRPPAGFHDTGVELITADPAPRVRSRDVAYGLAHCWG